MNQPMTPDQIANAVHHASNALPAIIGAGLSIPIILAILSPLINVFFCLSCDSVMHKISKQARTVPAWLTWLMLIPIIGYVFQWIMLPFSIPRSINKYSDNYHVIKKTKALYGLGLSYVILTLFSLIPFAIAIVGIPMLILWILYWVKISEIKTILKQLHANNLNMAGGQITSNNQIITSNEPDRPILITIFLIWAIIGFVVMLIAIPWQYKQVAMIYQSMHYPLALYKFTLILSPITAILCFFMLFRANWARFAYVVVSIITWAVNVHYSLFHINLFFSILGIVFSALIIILLFTPKSNRYFSYSKKKTEPIADMG